MRADVLAGISQLAADAAPAGGAATGETLVATAGALLISAAMLAIVAAHRSGRVTLVKTTRGDRPPLATDVTTERITA